MPISEIIAMYGPEGYRRIEAEALTDVVARNETFIMAELQSSSQTVGPYLHIGCTPSLAGLDNIHEGQDLGTEIFVADTFGNWITISG